VACLGFVSEPSREDARVNATDTSVGISSGYFLRRCLPSGKERINVPPLVPARERYRHPHANAETRPLHLRCFSSFPTGPRGRRACGLCNQSKETARGKRPNRNPENEPKPRRRRGQAARSRFPRQHHHQLSKVVGGVLLSLMKSPTCSSSPQPQRLARSARACRNGSRALRGSPASCVANPAVVQQTPRARTPRL